MERGASRASAKPALDLTDRSRSRRNAPRLLRATGRLGRSHRLKAHDREGQRLGARHDRIHLDILLRRMRPTADRADCADSGCADARCEAGVGAPAREYAFNRLTKRAGAGRVMLEQASRSLARNQRLELAGDPERSVRAWHVGLGNNGLDRRQDALEAIIAEANVPGTHATLGITGEFEPLVASEASRRLFEHYAACARSLGQTVEGVFAGGCADSGLAERVGAQ